MQTTIYVIRHGESVLNKQGLISGHANPGLTERGKKQVEEAKSELSGINFDDVYSSDLKRAAHTAEIIYGQTVPPANRKRVLRERQFGSLDGKPESLLAEGNAKKLVMSHEESWAFKHAPDMESDKELSDRFVGALESIARDHPGETILVGAHGGAIRTTIMKLTGYTNKELPSGSFKNAGYVELRYNPGEGFRVIQISGVKL